MSRVPLTQDMTLQQIVERLIEQWPAQDSAVFQVALEVQVGREMVKLVVEAAFTVTGPHDEWPDLLPSTGVPGQPMMQELEKPDLTAEARRQWLRAAMFTSDTYCPLPPEYRYTVSREVKGDRRIATGRFDTRRELEEFVVRQYRNTKRNQTQIARAARVSLPTIYKILNDWNGKATP